MILVLASSANTEAAAFVKKFTNSAASLFTCYDLAVGKSSIRFPLFNTSTITINNKKITVNEIRGVINLLPAVFPGELFFYPQDEREYQSAEFHALLTFFLSALECPVVNKPTSLSLNGPFINPMSWFHAAQEVGIPLSSMKIASVDPPDPTTFHQEEELMQVSSLGGKLILPSGTIADRYTEKLASYAGVEYLKVYFKKNSDNDIFFTRAQTIPDSRDEVAIDAFSQYFHL